MGTVAGAPPVVQRARVRDRSSRLNRGERRAAWWYRVRGWRLVGANVRAGGNEIDLIVRRGRSLRFVEVKERASGGFGGAAGAIGAEKQRRVRRAAEAWLAAHPECAQLEVGFDAVAVEAGRLERLGDAF